MTDAERIAELEAKVTRRREVIRSRAREEGRLHLRIAQLETAIAEALRSSDALRKVLEKK